MTVERPDVIDVIGTDRESGDVILSIADHLPWGEWLKDHAFALEQKLRAYSTFIQSGQVLEGYPNAVGRAIRIQALLLHPPDAAGVALLSQARESLAASGLSFSWRVPEIGSDELARLRAGNA